MTDAAGPAAAAGVLSWYSTIHVPPPELPDVLAAFRRMLVPGGTLVLGFFAGDDVTVFEHAITPAYRWPPEVLARLVTGAGFTETERFERQVSSRPDRTYAALAALAVGGQGS